MTHLDEGHYALKHLSSATPDARIAEAVKQKTSNGKITCAASHKIATELKVTPSKVGLVSDLLEVKLCKCQLGLFGYGPQRRIVKPAETIMPALKQAIETSLVDNRLPCLTAWEIADRFGLKKMDISSACEALKVKISACQIGSFK